MQLREVVQAHTARLQAAQVESAQLEAQLLVAHVLGKDRTWVVANGSDPADPNLAEELLMRRLGGEPLAYILGHREFYSRRFAVGPGALIPRQETEHVVEVALQSREQNLRVVDIGTGSGILAITLKLERPDWQVTAVDISPEALEWAAKNARTLGAEITLLEGDLLGGLPASDFDLLVSNPPYIGRGEPLPTEISGFEPHAALYAENEGLAIYQRLAKEAKGIPRIVLEIGYRQGDSVKEVFGAEGWRAGSLTQDYAGHDRVWEFFT